MYQAFLVKYAEIGIKGKNRYKFENALCQQMERTLKPLDGEFVVERQQGRIFVEAKGDFDEEDAAIESADVVIQTDQPSKVATAISIGRATRRIVKQNIAGAIGVKSLILIAGACGFVTLWAAVFADVGVALLAVLNSVRILSKKFE